MTQKSIVQSYLFFDGKCEEAIEFYKRAVGAEVVMVKRFKDAPADNPGCKPPAGSDNKIMHGQVRIGESVVMMSDGRCTGQPKFEGFALSLSLSSAAEVNKAFAALSEGGQVQMPLNKTFFSEFFGMVVDRFGVFWMVMVKPYEC